VLVNLIVKPFWIFGIDRTIQNITGAEMYGEYFSLYAFSLFFSSLPDLGINNFVTIRVAFHSSFFQKYFFKLFFLKLVFSIFVIAVAFLFGFSIGYSLFQLKLLLFLILNQIFISFIGFFRANLSGLFRFKTDSILSVFDRLIVIIFLGSILFFNFPPVAVTIDIFVISQTIAYFLCFLLGYGLLVFNHRKLIFSFPDLKFSIVLLKRTLPYAILVILMGVYMRLDAVFIERFLINGKSMAGEYAKAYRIFDVLAIYGFLVAGILIPIFAKLISTNAEISVFLEFSFLMLLFPILIFVSVAFNNSSYILSVLYHHVNPITEKVFQILMISFLFYCFTYIFGALLTAENKIMILNKLYVKVLIIHFILNLLFIHSFGIIGAAYTLLFTQIIVALFQFWLCRGFIRMKSFLFLFLKLILMLLLLLLVGNSLVHFHFTIFIQFIVIGLIALVFALVVNLINFSVLQKTVINLLKRNELTNLSD